MENKKLLKYLLKDLSELDEMFAEKGKSSFDDFEMEFIQNRISGAKSLVEMFLKKETNSSAEIETAVSYQQKPEIQNAGILKDKLDSNTEVIIKEIEPEEKTVVAVEVSEPEIVVQEEKPEIKVEAKAPETIIEEKVHVIENIIKEHEVVEERNVEIHEKTKEEVSKQKSVVKDVSVQKELQLDDEVPVDIHNKRLGDSFLKEKSVNDLMAEDSSKLEHKLSNRPVSSIQSAIGINDRFQYIRELFEGSADNFVKTVADLDSMDDIKEAVDYLQHNFKWKKNESSLKFVNLIKRRFPNE